MGCHRTVCHYCFKCRLHMVCNMVVCLKSALLRPLAVIAIHYLPHRLGTPSAPFFLFSIFCPQHFLLHFPFFSIDCRGKNIFFFSFYSFHSSLIWNILQVDRQA
ncbi:hypothetical protein ES288_D06G155100v1 [Gossypium darwinii]|uniref:Uncharacterized protein n=2 Tax=Gossypium TaxID=3633 RepID=A0A5D2KJI0_GOSTO|nr:hypothetical protein ES288_D06G155100v1 [Gossypium darwinii]TYH67004.1 hypothetical protein ES332_D06G157600v1 [Gossypium tomentosum]